MVRLKFPLYFTKNNDFWQNRQSRRGLWNKSNEIDQHRQQIRWAQEMAERQVRDATNIGVRSGRDILTAQRNARQDYSHSISLAEETTTDCNRKIMKLEAEIAESERLLKQQR